MSLLAFSLFGIFSISGCAIFSTRPIQEMSDTASAIRAAREVQAETLAPDLFRRANEYFFKAKREYKLKNFREAREYARRSRILAEQAEFEAFKTPGVSRTEGPTPDPMANEIETAATRQANTPPVNPPAKPAPLENAKTGAGADGTPYEVWEEKNKQPDPKSPPDPLSSLPTPSSAGGPASAPTAPLPGPNPGTP